MATLLGGRRWLEEDDVYERNEYDDEMDYDKIDDADDYEPEWVTR